MVNAGICAVQVVAREESPDKTRGFCFVSGYGKTVDRLKRGYFANLIHHYCGTGH